MGQPRPLSDYYSKAFYKLNYHRCIDDQFSISAACWRGLSSRPGLTQQWGGSPALDCTIVAWLFTS